ncbi:hypothetical protein GCM10010191_55420 [Actinomadura vinacea]|uniref:Uncharacterized protein n=1 Tax=Actinomadura vinacea TaxID=115336 RepID=A0ABP5WUM9_9ACTN
MAHCGHGRARRHTPGQEDQAIVSRVDQARLDKLPAEHDPFATPKP